MLLILQLRFGLDEEMMAVLEAHWSPKVVDNEMLYGWEVGVPCRPPAESCMALPVPPRGHCAARL